MADQDEGLPPEVQAQVDAIKKEEGVTTDDGEKFTEEVEQVSAPPPAPPKGRRAQQEQERNNLIRAAEERAAKAEAAAEKVAKESAERLARLEGLIEAGNQQRQQPIYVQAPPYQQQAPRDWQSEHRTAMRDAQKALAAGDLDGYHENLDKANDVKVEARLSQRMQEMDQRWSQQQAPQAPQKPIWLTAVENQFSDVLSHQRGPGTVAAFMQMEGIGPQNFNAESMQKAFARARKELGLSNGTPAPTEQQRQVHAGGPVNGSSRPAPTNGASKQVKVPKNWRQVARAAGMTPEEYLRAAKAME